MSTTDRTTRVLRQHIETIRLMGVDIVPRARSTRRSPSPTPRPEPEPVTATEPEGGPGPGPGPGPGAGGGRDEGLRILKLEALEELRERHAATCPHCTSATGIANLVFGEGAPDAELMFVGEAPGAEEDRTGRPFVGRAGQKLDDMIAAMGRRRSDVYIANVLKARPPNNRTPLPNEVAGCSPFLMEQITIIRPTVIVTLGGPATKLLLATDEGITRLRGRWQSIRVGERTVDVMPTFHPAYLLRNYTRETRERVWSDLKAVVERLAP